MFAFRLSVDLFNFRRNEKAIIYNHLSIPVWEFSALLLELMRFSSGTIIMVTVRLAAHLVSLYG